MLNGLNLPLSNSLSIPKGKVAGRGASEGSSSTKGRVDAFSVDRADDKFKAKKKNKIESQAEPSAHDSDRPGGDVRSMPRGPKAGPGAGSSSASHVDKSNSDSLPSAKNKISSNKSVEDRKNGGEVDPLTRRVAMQTFLKKMKEQLEVDPEKLMQAFAGLAPEDLVLPPEETVQKIISELDIDPGKVVVAEQLFEDMLRQTASSSMAEHLKNNGQNLSLDVLTRDEIRQRNVDVSINKMNEKFFVDNKLRSIEKQVVVPQADPQMKTDQALSAYQGQLGANGQKNESATAAGLVAYRDAMAGQGTTAAGNQAATATATPTTTPSAAEAAPSSQAAINQGNTDLFAGNELFEAKTGLNVNTGNLGNNLSPEVSNSSAKAEMLSAYGSANESNNSETSSEMSGNGFDGNLGEQSSGDEQASLDEGQQVSYQETLNKTGSKNVSKDFAVSTPQATEAEESGNVRELISQARYMVQKGGGEMKVQMTPEGLGEVHLKVAVKDGAVNVEMVTESGDAKKILEKGLGDLKATLASHKLGVEGIKIDVAGELANELQQQQEQADKQQAHRFLQDFKQHNQAWRNNFQNFTGARSVESQSDGSNDDSALRVEMMNKKSKAERRLDLVA